MIMTDAACLPTVDTGHNIAEDGRAPCKRKLLELLKSSRFNKFLSRIRKPGRTAVFFGRPLVHQILNPNGWNPLQSRHPALCSAPWLETAVPEGPAQQHRLCKFRPIISARESPNSKGSGQSCDWRKLKQRRATTISRSRSQDASKLCFRSLSCDLRSSSSNCQA